jgi:macrolide transport system ATP-binding/permease protein
MLTVADAQAIAREGDAFESVTFISRQVAQVVNGNRNWSTSVTGTGADYLKIRDWPVQSGRGFTDGEARRGANVCLLGQTVVKNLYADSQDPVDTAIRIKNVPMRVVGLLAPKGQSNTGHDQDDVVLVPFETAERKVLGVATAVAVTDPESGYNPSLNYASKALNVFGSTARITGKVHAIYAKTISADRVELGIEQITETLRRQHHLTPGKDDDFTVRNLQDIAQASEGAARILTLLLAAVASISLLVGGIGIMNIMLVSVTERTREIGIRIAIGARRHHILFQFLIEAILLSTIGGLAGTLLGVIASNVISIIANWPTSVSWTAIVGSFAFSAIIGVFFGYYPARQASFLNPIEALRYE